MRKHDTDETGAERRIKRGQEVMSADSALWLGVNQKVAFKGNVKHGALLVSSICIFTLVMRSSEFLDEGKHLKQAEKK